jgi:glycine hydroxymethyltransferase
MVTFGIRFGTPAGTSRGFTAGDFRRIGELIVEVLQGLRGHKLDEARIRADIKRLTDAHPVKV